MNKIPAIDMHCDTISVICSREVQAQNRKAGKCGSEYQYTFSFTDSALDHPIELRENTLHIDAKRLKEGGYMCQSFAMYVSANSAKSAGTGRFEYLCRLSDALDREIGKNSDLIRMAYSGSEIEKNFREGYVSCLKTVEEGLPYEGKLENLQEAYRRGVRKSSLTWNYENELAFGHTYSKDEQGRTILVVDHEHGLKKTGFEFIEAMEEMGMVIDISHLNDAGVRDIFETIRPSTPIVASHSNARAVCAHARNLPDELIKKLADHGGVTGINVCAAFLADDQLHNPELHSRISDMVRHMQYIKNLAGIDTVGLGTDFDGTGGNLDINGAGEIQKLVPVMEQAGFTDDEIEKVFYKNVLRVYKEVLG